LLEHSGSADARRVLDAITAGSAGPRVAASAKESLERIATSRKLLTMRLLRDA
jgi:hypothetical protein